MEFIEERLDKLCNIVLGRTPSRSKKEYWGDGNTWVSISDLKSKYITTTKEEITDLGVEKSRSRLIPKGTLLLSFKLSIGKLAFAGKDLYTNEAIAALPIIDEKEIDNDYLYYVLKYIPLIGGNQAAMGQTLNKESLSKLKIPYPKSLTDQKRIAKVLSHCEQLIAWRKESMDLLDDYLEAVFLEMFGPEFKNPKKWNKKLKDVVPSIDSGWSPKCKAEPRTSEDDWAVLKLSCVTKQYFDSSKNKLCFPNTVIKKEIIPSKGDLLFSRKNTFELVGATAFVYKDYKRLLLPDTIFRLNYLKEKISGIFLWYLFNSPIFSPKIRNLASGAAGSMPNISKAKLLNLKIPYPPVSSQKKFSRIVEETETIKQNSLESLQELENLFASLTQRAFKGELDLSKIEIEEVAKAESEHLKQIDRRKAEPKEAFDKKAILKQAGKRTQKINIRNLSFLDYLEIPYEFVENRDNWMFDFTGMDEFYQFLLKDNFPEDSFTFGDIEAALYNFYYHKGNMDFDQVAGIWKDIIFKFLSKPPPLLQQIFDKETGRVKLKLTDEAFEA